MATLPDVMTSESPDVNVSNIINVTSVTTGKTAGTAGQPAMAVILRAAILLTLNVSNVCGNGFTLVTIRLTPRLWTKTNFILASMLVADVITAVLMLWYTGFILAVYVFSNPCRHSVLITALTPLMKMTV